MPKKNKKREKDLKTQIYISLPSLKGENEKYWHSQLLIICFYTDILLLFYIHFSTML